MSDLKLENGIKWVVRQRLEFIENELFCRGRLNRANLTREFGISGVQATMDLSLYAEHAPGNMVYDPNEKCYLQATTFTPRFIETSVEHYLAEMAVEREAAVEVIPSPSRQIDKGIFQTILQAVQNRTPVKIAYQSMSQPGPRERVIAPHKFCSNGLRWHVRAYCSLVDEFRDFLLARILSAQPISLESPLPGPDQDAAWNTLVPLEIEPHPGLTNSQREVIALDYGMDGGILVFEVRQTSLFYTLQRLRLLNEVEDPAEQQIRLKNREEILARLKGTGATDEGIILAG